MVNRSASTELPYLTRAQPCGASLALALYLTKGPAWNRSLAAFVSLQIAADVLVVTINSSLPKTLTVPDHLKINGPFTRGTQKLKFDLLHIIDKLNGSSRTSSKALQVSFTSTFNASHHVYVRYTNGNGE